MLKKKEDSTVIVQLPEGRIRGRVLKTPNGNTFYAFQQVPYAAPPVGNLRFKEPQPVRRWRGILDTTNNTKVCQQGGMYKDDRETEDCLHVNVYVPKLPRGECRLMPVMFYIFGGAFNAGHSGYDFYGPELFMDYGVIVITSNYRTGALGFLTTEDNVLPPNLGLKDQLYALKWVNQNIEIFGGNASEVTVMAHSSGAGAASYHLHSGESSGLFRAMILQSGTSISPGMIQKYGKYFAYQAGELVSPDFNSRNTSTDLLNLLLDLPANKFRDLIVDIPLHMKNSIANNSLMWAPVIENEGIQNAFILGPMHENIKHGYINRVPTLMGIVTQEEGEFISQTVPEDEVYKYDQDPSLLICSTINIRDEYKESMGRDLRSIYTNGTFEEDYDAFLNFYSSERFTTPTIRHAHLQSHYTDVYFYQFSYVGELGQKSEIKWRGPRMVVHAEELAYIFFEKNTTNFDRFPEEDVLTSDRVMRMWTNFIKYLNPTPAYDPLLQNVIWPPVTPNNFLYLDIGNDLILKKDPKEYLAWKRVYDNYVDGPLDVY